MIQSTRNKQTMEILKRLKAGGPPPPSSGATLMGLPEEEEELEEVNPSGEVVSTGIVDPLAALKKKKPGKKPGYPQSGPRPV